MYDMRDRIARHFKVTLPNGLGLEIEPPKMKVLRKLMKLSKAANSENFGEQEINDLTEAIAIALSKNKQKRKITAAEIEDMLDLDEMIDLLMVYFDWVEEITSSKN